MSPCRFGLPSWTLVSLLVASPIGGAEPDVRRDVFGDPLPPGAVARLGTARLRHGDVVEAIAFTADGKLLASAGRDNVVRLWDTATGRLVRALREHTNPIMGVAFAPDGKTLATSSWDSSLRFWDVQTGKSLRVIKRRHAVTCVAFAPDGKIVATTGSDGVVRLWDPDTGEEVRHCSGHNGDIRHLCFSPDGKMLASAGLDRTVRFWDPATGGELGRITAPPIRAGSGAVSPIAFAPDGKKFAVALVGQVVKIYDGAVSKELATFDKVSGSIRSLAFAPDGRTLATAGTGHGVQLWDAATMKNLGSYGDKLGAACVAFHGKIMATSENNTIRLWDTASGKELPRGEGHRDAIQSLAFVAKGKYVATGGGEGSLRLWEPSTGRVVRLLPPHLGPIRALAFEPKSGVLASAAASEAVIHLWHPETGEKAKDLRDAGFGITSLAFSPDGKALAVGGMGTAVCLWDVASGRQTRTVGAHPRGVRVFAFTPDGKTLISSGGFGNGIFFWNAQTGALEHQLEGSHGPLAAALSADGKTLASTAMTKVRLWTMDMARKLGEVTADPRIVHSVAFSPDGKLLATGGANGSVRLWDWAAKKERNDLSGHEGAVLALAFSPDGKYLVSAGADSVGLVWDVDEVLKNPPKAEPPASRRSRRQASKPAPGGAPPALPTAVLARLGNRQFRHGGIVSALAFRADGTLLASGGADGTVRLWDAASGTEQRRFALGSTSISQVFFASGGKTLIAWDFDSIHAWDVADGTELARLGGERTLTGPIAVSPDGALVAVPAAERFNDPRIRLRSLVNGKSIKLLEGHTGGLWTLAFSADGKTLASASTDETIRLWDVAAGKQTTQWTGHNKGARRLVFSPDGKMLVSVGMDSTVRLWDVAAGKNVQSFRVILGFGGTAVFTPDGKTLALGLSNGTVQLVNCDDGKISRSWRIIGKSIGALAFTADGKTLAVGFGAGPLRLYDAATGQEKTKHEGHLFAIKQVAYSPDGKTLATLSHDSDLRYWDRNTHRQIRHREKGERRRPLVCLSANGRRLASCNDLGFLDVWDYDKGEPLWKSPAPVRAAALALSADGKLLAVSQYDGRVHLLSAGDGKPLRQFRWIKTPPSRLAFSPDAAVLAGQSGRMVNLWDTSGQEPMQSFDLQWAGNAELIFAPDSRTLATLALGGSEVRWWEVASHQLRTKITGPREGIGAAVFSRDGKVMILAGNDRTLRSWDLAAGQPLRQLEVESAATALACSPDGRTLAAGNEDTTALVWDAARLLRRNEPPDVRLELAALDRLWLDLAGDNAIRAYAAMRRLAGSPRQAVELLKERSDEQHDEEQKRLRQLLAQLDSDQFSQRERAARELLRMGRRAEASLRKVVNGKPSAELGRRATDLLEKLRAPENRATPLATLAELRAVEVLERLDTTAARDVLKHWAEGGAEEPRTQAAKAALARRAKP